MRLKTTFSLLFFNFVFFNFISAQTPCVDGFAGQYPCKNVDLLSVLTPDQLAAEEHHGQWLNDIWGWTDPITEKEYAIVGMVNGVSFVDISDPVNPVFLGILPETNATGRSSGSGRHEEEANSWWRDIKVYKDYAYIVAEEQGHGMQVFDLKQLRNISNPPEVFSATTMYTKIGSAHNLAINEDTGYAYILSSGGSSICNSLGLHVVNIKDPANPVYESCFNNQLKVHDSQSIVYNGPDTEHLGKEICINSNESSLSIDDVTDKKNIYSISSFAYNNLYYAHQGWVTEDHKYFLSNDEIDESSTGNRTRTLIWDITNLETPTLIGSFYSSLYTIDHNMYVQDNYMYQSNYTAGLRILDLSNVSEGELTEAGYFDTFHQDNSVGFDGTWSNFPFFKSGNVIVADMRNGLFVVRPNLNKIISSEPSNVYCPDENTETKFSIESSVNDLNYQWQVKEGSIFKDLNDQDIYSNINTNELTINSLPNELGRHYYRCKVTTQDGTNYYSMEGMLLVGESPDVNFSFEIENIDATNNILKFTNTSNNGDSYVWDFGDNTPLVEDENPTHQYRTTGTFEVTLTVINDCGQKQKSESVTLEITGIEDIEKLNKFNAYPIPANEELNIVFENTSTIDVQLSLFNLTGQLISNENVQKSDLKFEHTFNLKNYKNGIYYLRVKSGDQIMRKKILIR